MTKTKACQAKNPTTCPYHGSTAQADTLKAKINALFNKTPLILAPELGSSKTMKYVGKIEILPNNKAAKTSYTKTVEAETYSELMDKIRDEADNLDTAGLNKKLKTGYRASITTPINATDPDVTSTSTSYNAKDVTSMKTLLKDVANENQAYNESCEYTINNLKDTPLGQTPKGIKGIALMEAMAKFNFPSGGHPESDINASWDYLVKGEGHEYTNRSYGIRVHPRYDRKGELLEATFSLDGPHTSYSTFNQTQVDRTNTELNNYFQEVEKQNTK